MCNLAQAMRCDYVESAADEREPHQNRMRCYNVHVYLYTTPSCWYILYAGIFEFQTHK